MEKSPLKVILNNIRVLKMKKRYQFLIAFSVAVVATYFLGPKPPNPDYETVLPQLPYDLDELDNYIKASEEGLPLRKNNQARIVWQNATHKKTEYSIVYLHGFAASWRDGYPVNMQLADALEANIFLARMPGHGLKPEAAMKNFSPDNVWNYAQEALAIGNKIGKKVIILSTSTGGTLALKLAAEYPDSVFALINLSPNVQDDQEGAFLLNSPWGYEIANLITLGKRKIEHEQKAANQYFDTIYPADALVDLQVVVGSTMKEETFNQIKTPMLTLYYYKNFLKEDEHVEVEVYDDVYEELGTPEHLRKLVPLETPKTHFIGSSIKSQDTEVVLEEILEFLENYIKHFGR